MYIRACVIMQSYNLHLTQYCGKGIDLRARKVWRLFGCRADLEVRTLTPSDVTVFPEYDWLIGNHSDELTPWIPLMAARCVLILLKTDTKSSYSL